MLAQNVMKAFYDKNCILHFIFREGCRMVLAPCIQLQTI